MPSGIGRDAAVEAAERRRASVGRCATNAPPSSTSSHSGLSSILTATRSGSAPTTTPSARRRRRRPADSGRRLVDALIVLIRPDRQLGARHQPLRGPDLRVRRRVARTPGVAKMDPLAPDPPRRGRARAPAGDHAPPRGGLHQPEHPPGLLSGALRRLRRLARRPAALAVQRQLLLPLGVSHFCRFRSSWIKINNDDACGPCGRRLRRPKRGGKRAASTVTHCRSARARFPCRWRGPQAARLPDGPECSRGRPAVGSGQQRTGSTPAGSRRRRRFPRERSVRQLGTLETATSKGTGRPRRRRLQPRGRRVRSVGTLPNPGRPPRPVSRRGRPGRRRPGRDRKAHNCHLSRGTDGVSPEGP